MDNEFEQFARAVQSGDRRASVSDESKSFERIAVLGGGVDGRVMAALCLAEGASVTLFSAYGAELNELRQRGGVTLRGEGPVGTFQVDQESIPSIRVTAELDAAVADAELIIMTGPVHKQRTYAMVLADHLRDGQTLLITPGRTFSALETRWLLHVGGCQADMIIMEMIGLPYFIHDAGGVYELSAVAGVSAGSIPSYSASFSGLSQLFASVSDTQNALQSSLADASGIMECVAFMIGDSLITEPDNTLPLGATPLPENHTFHSLLESDTARNLISYLLAERRRVASRLGVRHLPDDSTWTESVAGASRGAGSRRVPDRASARAQLRCAVTGSLVPLQSTGRLLDVATPYTDAMINMVSAALGHNLVSAGRQLTNMGIDPGTPDEVRKQLEAAVRGPVNG